MASPRAACTPPPLMSQRKTQGCRGERSQGEQECNQGGKKLREGKCGGKSSLRRDDRLINLLIVCELLFSLPFTNSKVERSFSHVKVIKSERRSSLCTSTLDDLMEINMEGPALESFTADSAVDLWWKDTTRRPNQKEQKDYAPRESSSSRNGVNELSKPTEEYSLDD